MTARWRPLQVEDLGAVAAISDQVHGRYTEPMALYAERQRLYPRGCFLFEVDGRAAGYLVSHPWRRDDPPALGAMLGLIPADAGCYYLHDVALLPVARGTGAGRDAVRIVLAEAVAGKFSLIQLVAVGGAENFWAAQGFTPVQIEAISHYLHDHYGPEAMFMQRGIVPCETPPT